MSGAPEPIPENNSDDVVIQDGHFVHIEKKEDDGIDMEKVEQDNIEYDD